MSKHSNRPPSYWLRSSHRNIDSICIGTGRFLRTVLVPALVDRGHAVLLIQPRGRSFLDYLLRHDTSTSSSKYYLVETVLSNGQIETSNVPLHGVFTFLPDDEYPTDTPLPLYQSGVLQSLVSLPKILGVGVTEAGLISPETPIMKNLYQVLRHLYIYHCHRLTDDTVMSVINTDNVPNNGDVLKSNMLLLALNEEFKDPPNLNKEKNWDMEAFLKRHVHFHNSMVDRIVSQSPVEPQVPRAEPAPAKALVISDPTKILNYLSFVPWIVLRSSNEELGEDVELKLRVANGTHTALAHVAALLGLTMTNHVVALNVQILIDYIDSVFESCIFPGWVYGPRGTKKRDGLSIQNVWDDWRNRLWHSHFGLSTFFITQNGPAKGGIRLGPTIRNMIENHQGVPVVLAFSIAALLKWLTPMSDTHASQTKYRGKLQPSRTILIPSNMTHDTSNVEYADKLFYNLQEGWYEFRCDCLVERPNGESVVLSDWLANFSCQHSCPPSDFYDAVRAYLVSKDGGNLSDVAVSEPSDFNDFVSAVAIIYADIVFRNDCLGLLQMMKLSQGVYDLGMATCCASFVKAVSLGDK